MWFNYATVSVYDHKAYAMIRWLLTIFIVRRLRHNAFGALLLVTAVALAVAVFVAVLQTSQAGISSFERTIVPLAGSSSIELRSRRHYFSATETATLVRSLSESAVIIANLSLPAQIESPKNVTITLLGIDPSETPVPRAGITRSIGYASADLRQLLGASTVHLSSVGKHFDLAIEAVPQDSGLILPPRTIVSDLAHLQDLVEMPGKLSSLTLTSLSNNAAPPISVVQSALSEDFYIESETSRAQRGKALLSAFRFNIQVMVLMTLLAAMFAILNAAQLSVISLRREVAILLTLGASRGLCLGLLLSEAGILGFLGAMLGLSLGYPLSQFVAALFQRTASSLYGVELDMGRSLLSPMLIIGGLLVGVGVAVLGALYPAWLGSRVSLALATKTEQPPKPLPIRHITYLGLAAVALMALCILGALHYNIVLLAHASALFLIFAILLASAQILTLCAQRLGVFAAYLGLPGSIALSNIRSGGSSTAISLAASAIGITLLIGLGVMISSFRDTLTDWITYTVRADVFVKALGADEKGRPTFIPENAVREILGATAVAQYSRFSSFASELQGTAVTLAGTDFLAFEQARVFKILDGRLDTSALRSGEAVLLSESAAHKLRTRVGAVLMISNRSYRVCGIYKDFSDEQGYVLFGFEHFASTFFATESPSAIVQNLGLYLKQGADSAVFATSYSARYNPISVQFLLNAELRREILNVFDNTFLITKAMRLVIVLICGLGFVVSMLQLVWERRRELRTLQILGASAAELRRSVLLEACFIGLPAAILGIGGGLVLAWILVELVNPLAFGWTLSASLHLEDLLLPLAIFATWNVILSILPYSRITEIARGARVSDE